MKCWRVFVEIERSDGRVRSARSRWLSWTEARALVDFHRRRGRAALMRCSRAELERLRAQLAAGGLPQCNTRGKLGRRPPPSNPRQQELFR